MREIFILILVVLCGCTSQQEIEEQKRQQQLKAEEERKAEEQKKAEEEELSKKEKEFASDVEWILRHTLNNGFNPEAKKLEPNSDSEKNEKATDKNNKEQTPENK
ncbi:hypothetical protein [Candidatus Uabimicrobium amorphum]|uniref:Lipoprotein n=1 Tax=Uabimicrobium amorphum TaxID=2596890 RepID=A0A5S9IKC9_UABAM|nr:hypothetical protein [Candidatus Uabimicrobium amorphum]BBM83304.1 hypothetical protein UABAM_01655 [Candidatus Uabimicrobium amorphum]